MSIYLLDVNVLLALAWPTHIHHEAAHHWFRVHAEEGWATCPLTQLSFVRLSMQPAVVKVPILFGDALEVLAQSTASLHHRFLPMDSGVTAIREEIRSRIQGHHQLADATLLELAIRNEAVLATFDRKIAALLPPGSRSNDAIALISA